MQGRTSQAFLEFSVQPYGVVEDEGV
jgi:hypothetical protein